MELSLTAVCLELDLGMLVSGRTAPYNSFMGSCGGPKRDPVWCWSYPFRDAHGTLCLFSSLKCSYFAGAEIGAEKLKKLRQEYMGDLHAIPKVNQQSKKVSPHDSS